MEQLLFTGSAPPRHCASWPARLSDEHGPNAHMLREPCCRLGPAAGRAGPPFFPVLGHSIARPVPQASTSSPPLRGRGRSTSPCSSRHQAQSRHGRRAAVPGVVRQPAQVHPLGPPARAHEADRGGEERPGRWPRSSANPPRRTLSVPRTVSRLLASAFATLRGSRSLTEVVTCEDRYPRAAGHDRERVASPPLPDLRPTAQLAFTTRSGIVLQGHGAPRPAARGRRTPQNQPEASPGLGRPSAIRRADPTPPRTAARSPPDHSGHGLAVASPPGARCGGAGDQHPLSLRTGRSCARSRPRRRFRACSIGVACTAA